MTNKFEIRNSTAVFLTFVAEGKSQGVQVLLKMKTIWATQKAYKAYKVVCDHNIVGKMIGHVEGSLAFNRIVR